MIINVEYYRSPNKKIQCFRRQYFNHTADKCHMTPRRIKCNHQHETRNCPLGKEKLTKPICVNCSGNHIASYLGCPKIPGIVKSKIAPPFITSARPVAPPPQPIPLQNPHVNTRHNELNSVQEILSTQSRQLQNEMMKEMDVMRRTIKEMDLQLKARQSLDERRSLLNGGNSPVTEAPLFQPLLLVVPKKGI